jgi:hypothetical protein
VWGSSVGNDEQYSLLCLNDLTISEKYTGTPELGGGAGGAAAPVALYQEGQRCPFNLKDRLGEIANCQKC